jgi:hypothetical protein
MTRSFPAAALPLLLACAWPAHAADRPDPADPSHAVPSIQHRSAFDGFRSHGDPAVGDWRAVNETVGRVGGWRVYAREVAAGAADAERDRDAPAPVHGAAAVSRPDGPRPADPHHQHGAPR